MERMRLVAGAIAGWVKQVIWLIRDSESDVADLYPENQANGQDAAVRGSLFGSMSGVGHP